MIVAEHQLTAPGSASVLDAHYDGPRPAPSRGPRPKRSVERQFCDLGDDAQAFLVGVGAAEIGNTRLGSELEILLALGAAHGTDALLAVGTPLLGAVTCDPSWPPGQESRSPERQGTR